MDIRSLRRSNTRRPETSSSSFLADLFRLTFTPNTTLPAQTHHPRAARPEVFVFANTMARPEAACDWLWSTIQSDDVGMGLWDFWAGNQPLTPVEMLQTRPPSLLSLSGRTFCAPSWISRFRPITAHPCAASNLLRRSGFLPQRRHSKPTGTVSQKVPSKYWKFRACHDDMLVIIR